MNSPSEFRRSGYCRAECVLPTAILPDLLAMFAEHLDRAAAAKRLRETAYGRTFTLDWRDERLVDLLALPEAFAVFDALGLTDLKVHSFYGIEKPPAATALPWHQDWYAWREPASYGPEPPEIFAMYYPRAACVETGCLRVAPGSHREKLSVHERLPTAHTADFERIADSSFVPGEESIECDACDLVIGDRRLLHATHANRGSKTRPCIAVWYVPNYEMASERLKARIVTNFCLPAAGWWRESDPDIPNKLRPLLPVYDGVSPPAEFCSDAFSK